MFTWLIAFGLFAADAVIRLPGGHVGLALPSDFLPATATAGMQRGTALITNQRMPFKPDALVPSLTGQKIVRQETVKVGGRDARLIELEHQLLLGIEAGGSTELVVAHFSDPKDKGLLKSYLLTSRVLEGEPDAFAGYPLRFDLPKGLAPVGGGQLLFTPGGKAGARPSLSYTLAPVEGGEQPNVTFARLSGHRLTQLGETKIGALKAYRFAGKVKLNRMPVRITALLIEDAGHYHLLEAQTLALREKEEMPTLERALESLRPNSK